MLRNCPNNRANIKLFVCPKCGKAFKYQNQKLIELSKSKDVFTNKNYMVWSSKKTWIKWEQRQMLTTGKIYFLSKLFKTFYFIQLMVDTT